MANMIPISTVTVGSGGVSAVEFTNIPQTYTDLLIKISARSSTTTLALNLTVNGSTSGYSERLMYADGASLAGATASSAFINWLNLQNSSSSTSNTFSNCEIYIPNYTVSDSKSFSGDTVVETNAVSTNQIYVNAALWANTAPITSIKFTPGSGLVAQYSTATLYGIRKY
jgi:hypothetical protein